MKKYTKYLLSLISIGFLFQSCEDEELITLPVWESAVHGYAVVNGSATDFKLGDESVEIDFDLKWKSIDNKNKVTKIDLYVLFNETYTDPDGNSKIAKHGGESGKIVKSLSGTEVPENNTITSFTINQSDIYNLYSTVNYDYGYGDGMVPVFENPLKPSRNNTTDKFIIGDNFTIKWIFTTEDGRVFDSWSPSVCTEFPEANCQVDWTVSCATEVSVIAGDWTIYMKDDYGDGWQGGTIQVIVDGEVFVEHGLESFYDNEVEDSERTEIVTIPTTATSIYFNWIDDDYNGECIFSIKNPNGNTLANVTGPSGGIIKLDLCNE